MKTIRDYINLVENFYYYGDPKTQYAVYINGKPKFKFELDKATEYRELINKFIEQHKKNNPDDKVEILKYPSR